MVEALHSFVKITDLKDMLNKSGELYGDEPAYKFKTDKENEFKIITHKQVREDINCLGTALLNMNLKDKKIAVISENRYEWGVAYLAICTGVGIVVPLDKSLPDNEIENLIIRSEVEAIFYSNKYDQVMNNIKQKNNSKLKYYISMDLEENNQYVLSLSSLIKQGEDFISNNDTSFINAKIDSEKVSFVLFTSGTTSLSKAVMLSHKNICTNLMDIASVIELTPDDTLLSFLPLHHTFECTVGFLYPMYIGCSIAFCDGIRHIADNIREYKITAMISVPILYENMFKKLIKAIEKKGKLNTVKRGIKISNFFLKLGIDIRKKLFKEIHETLGGKVRLFVSGGAALDVETEIGFNELGFKIVSGYGLTETSPVIAAGNDRYTKIGSIGRVFPSLEVEIVNANEQGIGELIVKGPSIMLGYYNNEEETNKVLKNGWLYTGDLGYFDKDNFLYITGRKKNVIVLKNGKNIYPEEIEALINKIDIIKESFVYGKLDKDDDMRICAKIVYDKNTIQELYNISEQDEILQIIWKDIKEINKTMPPYKYIREIDITQDELIKTTTQKIKRHEELAKILGRNSI